MFIGHLPAGYIATKKLQETFHTSAYLWVGLIGSVFPDIDIIYFYLIDNRQTLHHSYWIHLPVFWLILASVTFLILYVLKKKDYMILAAFFYANIFLHLLLDTIVGKVEWLYPITEKAYSFFEVPAIYDFWVYNFVFHWTFLFEAGVIVWAVVLLVRSKKFIK